jgi:adenosylcobalamin-dependent ribonucleoside-triphosphate reductase
MHDTQSPAPSLALLPPAFRDLVLPPNEGNPYRAFDPGMGDAVAARTVTRLTNPDTNTRETWGAVGVRVAEGNTSLVPGTRDDERHRLARHIQMARILMSGRHLQHGDAGQASRPGEVYTNCSSAAFSFIKKYLLLNGSGVGRSYADALMLVDWAQMPLVIPTIGTVPKWADPRFLTPGARHPEATQEFWTTTGALAVQPTARVVEVQDTREGWAKAVEQIERAAYEWDERPIILDFSGVRPLGAPIAGMQDRPASGPLPLMRALRNVAKLRERYDLDAWELTMTVDHLLAEVVQVGGARRAARIALKPWSDPGIFRFIEIKSKGGLWTANNSVAVDADFWARVEREQNFRQHGYVYGVFDKADHDLTLHAHAVFEAVIAAQYEHGSGEPGFVNVDRLEQNDAGMEVYADGLFAGSSRYQMDPESAAMGQDLVACLNAMPYKMIVNPCGEIPLLATGGYCVIGSTVPYFAQDLDEAIDAARHTARALVRANRMEYLYGREVDRTNRIGLSLVGLQEWAWTAFRLGFRDLLDETGKGARFWKAVRAIRAEVLRDVDAYCQANGWALPHTVFTEQPAGTIAKMFGLSEAAHLVAMREILRWVQFTASDPLVDEYAAKGYPVIRTITKGDGTVAYPGMSIVGFPTQPLLCRLGIPEDRLVTATEATVEEQFQWLRLLEKHWLGVGLDTRGAQISYTLKYRSEDVSRADYTRLMREHLPTVKCVSVMPASDWKITQAKYGYCPEEPITRAEYEAMVAHIGKRAEESLDMDSLACSNGACPM